MHFTNIAIIAAATGLSHAAVIKRDPQPTSVCSGPGLHYVCAPNGFIGSCSVDPCAMKWCPDYEEKTCTPKAPGNPVIKVEQPAQQCTGKGQFWTCANNKFTGACSLDPCALSWCPDYDEKTCTPKIPVTPVEKPPVEQPKQCAGTGQFYTCAYNKFAGACSVDPCALSWCPDYVEKTCNPKKPVTSITDPAKEKPTSSYKGVPLKAGETCAAPNWDKTCREGTGYYQKCDDVVEGCCNFRLCARYRGVA